MTALAARKFESLRRASYLAICSFAVVGCTAEAPSTAAPPLVVCGHTLSEAAAGPVLVDIAGHREVSTYLSVGGDLYLRVAQGCSRGVTVAVNPQAFQIIDKALASDGREAAVVVHPVQKSFSLDFRDEDDNAHEVAVTVLS